MKGEERSTWLVLTIILSSDAVYTSPKGCIQHAYERNLVKVKIEGVKNAKTVK
jgi:hypothetical protein